MTTRGHHPLEDLGEETGPALVALARALHVKDADLHPTLDAIISHAVATIEPAEHAGLILLVRGDLVPQATLGEPPAELDALQQATGSGPCVDAARSQTAITVDNTLTDPRWPQFSERAAALGVASMLCAPLWVDELRLGTLSLYGQKPDAFAPQHRQLTDLYATHAAIALADAQRTAQYQQALANRDTIGQAKGILVERLKVLPDEAFAVLSQASQAANRKLIVVARHLVESGELLGQ
jgi:GAF domain-containing protein